MGEYDGLYLKTDVLILTDIFENFRNPCMTYYGLDPAYQMTLPHFAWDAMLKKINIVLDLVHGQDMYEMIEKGKRRCMSSIIEICQSKKSILTMMAIRYQVI